MGTEIIGGYLWWSWQMLEGWESVSPGELTGQEEDKMKSIRKTILIKTWFSMELAAQITEKEKIGLEDLWRRMEMEFTCLLGWGV